MKKPKTTRLKKIKTEKIAVIDGYDMVNITYGKADDSKVKTRIVPPIKVKLSGKK